MRTFDEAVHRVVDLGKTWTQNPIVMSASRQLYNAVIAAGEGHSTELVEGRGPRMTHMEKSIANSAAVSAACDAVEAADDASKLVAGFIKRLAMRELRQAARKR